MGSLFERVTNLRKGASMWMLASICIAAVIFAPITALGFIAAEGSGDLWPHLLAYVFPRTTRDTLLLLLGVGAGVTVVGTGLAWLLTAYTFPGRKQFNWLLLLPLAMPGYIIAFSYLDLFHPVGPIPTLLRSVLGITRPQDLPFPEIRSLGGCIFLFSMVLYPYVFLSVRAMFAMQAGSLIEISRTLGASQFRIFFVVALPLARPAVVAGVSLALMETLNDIGASEFLGVQTLTVSIYSTWINRSNLPGAAQIALFMLVLVAALILAERWARQGQRYAGQAQKNVPIAPKKLKGHKAFLAITACALPVLFGFLLPAAYLIYETAKRVRFAGFNPQIGQEILNTLAVSASATILIMIIAVFLVYASRISPSRTTLAAVRFSSFGYAVPGTILAIGLLVSLAALDNAISNTLNGAFGISTGLILSASGVAIVYAYSARFLAVAIGGTEAGFSKISPSLDAAARSLSHTRLQTLLRVHLPILRPALAAAALLVFVDCMKELPATLLLRPLNFETLSTHLYGEAARGTYEDGAIAALCIVMFGLLPVMLLARISSGEKNTGIASARGGPSSNFKNFPIGQSNIAPASSFPSFPTSISSSEAKPC